MWWDNFYQQPEIFSVEIADIKRHQFAWLQVGRKEEDNDTRHYAKCAAHYHTLMDMWIHMQSIDSISIYLKPTITTQYCLPFPKRLRKKYIRRMLLDRYGKMLNR